MVRVLLLGKNGFLGSCLTRHLDGRISVFSPERSEVDAASVASVEAVLENYRPDFVLNCVGFLNVDRCEADPVASYQGNFITAETVARAIARVAPNTHLIHFSSDFVFDGRIGNYRESDFPSPISVYGVHKVMADEVVARTLPERHYILRVASVLGVTDKKGNFLRALLGKIAQGEQLRVNETLKVSMASTEFIAEAIEAVLSAVPPSGPYNLVAEGVTTWFDMLAFSCRVLGVDAQLSRAEIEEYPNAHLRPRNSYLNLGRLRTAFPQLSRDWQTVLTEHIASNSFYRDLFK